MIGMGNEEAEAAARDICERLGGQAHEEWERLKAVAEPDSKRLTALLEAIHALAALHPDYFEAADRPRWQTRG